MATKIDLAKEIVAKGGATVKPTTLVNKHSLGELQDMLNKLVDSGVMDTVEEVVEDTIEDLLQEFCEDPECALCKAIENIDLDGENQGWLRRMVRAIVKFFRGY